MSAPEIPAGMKPWHGGAEAPADWDGGPVRLRDGSMWYKRVTWAWRASGADRDAVAYTPTAPELGAGLMDLEPAMVSKSWAVDAPVEYPAFASWWARTIPYVVTPHAASHEFGVWMAAKRHALAAAAAAAPTPLGCDPVVRENERLREALDAAHYYIDASDEELREAGLTRFDTLYRARHARAALSQSIPGEQS
jgi:hypothetical protein